MIDLSERRSQAHGTRTHIRRAPQRGSFGDESALPLQAAAMLYMFPGSLGRRAGFFGLRVRGEGLSRDLALSFEPLQHLPTREIQAVVDL